MVGGPPPSNVVAANANSASNVLLPINGGGNGGAQDPALSGHNKLNEISNDLDSLPMENKLAEKDEDLGFVDSVLGSGTQDRIVASVNNWVANKAKTNPGCVERFVCETYRTGENMQGIPYLFMSLTNAAVSFYVAEIFDESIDIQEITRAARYGRTIGTCHNMKCPVMDGQLRTLSGIVSSLEEFFGSIFTSVSSSIAG